MNLQNLISRLDEIDGGYKEPKMGSMDSDYGPYGGDPRDPRTPELSDEEVNQETAKEWINELESLDLEEMTSIDEVNDSGLRDYLKDIQDKEPKLSLEDTVVKAIDQLSAELPGDDYSDEEPLTDSINNEENCAEVDECGGPMSMPMRSPMSQQDSVNMSLNINGSGSGGIRDILDLLKNFESPDHELSKMSTHKIGEPPRGKQALIDVDTDINKEELANSPQPVTLPVSSVTASGNDLHKAKDSYSDKPYRGDNPMAIRSRLESLYSKIKESSNK